MLNSSFLSEIQYFVTGNIFLMNENLIFRGGGPSEGNEKLEGNVSCHDFYI